MTSINDLKQVRRTAMLVAAVACALGFVGSLGGMLGDQLQAASWLRPFSISLAWASLICIVTVLATMFLVWMPVHDQIVASLSATYDTQRGRFVGLSEGFRSAPQRRSTPPPRRHPR
ncbi:hypothetical protein [Xylophilus sp. ASV27]|uniref:hypothetical protein n=1 Tax=Xylophilus sp. ASV27 TaxID=2795129 RepID=UPI0018ED0E54|nr:hypothetical protein [Xylophilus sp. ASV27]